MWLPKKEKKYTNILNKIGKIMFPKKMTHVLFQR